MSELEASTRRMLRTLSLALVAAGCGPESKPPQPDPAQAITPSAPAPSGAAAPAEVPSADAVASAEPPPDDPAPTASASTQPPTAASTAPPSSPPPPPPPRKLTPREIERAVEGRPFLVEGAPRLASTSTRVDWLVDLDLPPAAEEDEPRLVRHLTAWSLAEHASIASFARFAMQLLALGAPPDLVQEALRAADDEVRHARIGFGLVQAVGGPRLGPGPISMHQALPRIDLDEALYLVAVEGMIGETLAALELDVAASRATGKMGALLRSIAEDEARHAALAYRFAAWALGQSPSAATILERARSEWTVPLTLPGEEGLEPWGILDPTRRREIQIRGFEAVVTPLFAQVSTPSDPVVADALRG